MPALLDRAARISALDAEIAGVRGPFHAIQVDLPPSAAAEEDRRMGERDRLARALGPMRATTLAELRAKALVALDFFTLNRDGTCAPYRDEYLAWTICRDLIALEDRSPSSTAGKPRDLGFRACGPSGEAT